MKEADDQCIAIIGIGCRFPDARDPGEFWRNLCSGHESVREFSDDELRQAGGDPANRAHKNFVGRGVILDGIDEFDASFFGYSPRDAEILDPQQRLFLECSWHALEDAGYDPSRPGPLIGVFGGADLSSYLLNIYSDPEVLASVGPFAIALANDKDHLTTRVAYELNLKGPAITIQTACSTSLVAVCEACRSLLNYECDIALAGGAAISVSQGSGYFWEEGGISSPDAHCRAFDADARGTIGGSGVGLVVLKRYTEARSDGDHIYAVIRGFGLSNDGRDKIGYTAPSVDGQAQAILTAMVTADTDPDTISYIECHGTGTPLGDPIEFAALTQVFRGQTDRKQFCAIGSVKTNFGHLNSAAGVAGLIKTALALRHKMLPPSLNYVRPNPKIHFQDSPFFVVNSLRAWRNGSTPRRAGVSSFGLGGTNAHVVLEEAPVVSDSAKGRNWQLLTLSAKTATALDRMTSNLALCLETQAALDPADVAYSLQMGRKVFPYRRVALANSSEFTGAIEALSQCDPARLISGNGTNPPSMAFMFPGQGSQHAGMGYDLYQMEPVFREQVDAACDFLCAEFDFDLRETMYSPLHQTSSWPTALAQPALFVTEYALARLWMDWGVTPQSMLGHSIGEYVAACLSGVFSVHDALRLVVTRARLMQAMPLGAMVAVFLKESDASELAKNGLSLAAINGPSLCVLSGAIESVESLEAELTARSVRSQRLQTSHAFHSAMMDPVIDPFVNYVRRIDLQPPSRPYLSNLTGGWISTDQATDPEYWGQHLRQSVRFMENLRTMQSAASSAFLEVGPGRSLATLARNCLDEAFLVLSSLPHPHEQAPPLKVTMQALATLWVNGADVDWQAIHRGEKRRRIPLPTYPFERQRYWIGPSNLRENAALRHAKPNERRAIGDWFYSPTWKPVPLANCIGSSSHSSWLVLCGNDVRAGDLIAMLRERGEQVQAVGTHRSLACGISAEHIIDPMQPDDYERLFRDLSSPPKRIVHWCAESEQELALAREPAENESSDGVSPSYSFKALTASVAGFFSLFHLAKAIHKIWPGEEFDLVVITAGSYAISPWERIIPEQAMLSGASKVISQEMPRVHVRSIDLPADQEANAENCLDKLYTELESDCNGPIVALRESGRWVRDYLPISLEPTAAVRRLRRNGVYVITGGLGGIGLTFAQHLATKARAKLVLTSRTPFPERSQWASWMQAHEENEAVSRVIRKLQALEDAGSDVILAAADVVNAGEMHSLAQRVRREFGEVHGVVHAAGVAGGGMIALRTIDDVVRVIAAKVRGTQVVHQAFGNKPLDFFVLCSSLNALLGGFGQIDYCAANCYLDAFAHRYAGNKSYLVSINWDTWGDVGMALKADTPRGFEAQRQAELATAITQLEGALAIDFILSGSGPQIAVSTTDLAERLRRALRSPINIDNPFSDPPIAKYPRPHVSTNYVVPRDATEELIAAEWSRLLGVSPVGINDNFLEAGGHSLHAVHLIARLRETFRTELTIGAFFEEPTVSGVAQALRRAEPVAGQVDAIAALRLQMDHMPPEALQEWLHHEEELASLSPTV
jgi:acyl transferase domain-containing protein/NAD(P)-dependent dehydrogenase (short-subunit alcohol dehydrogenase family)